MMQPESKLIIMVDNETLALDPNAEIMTVGIASGIIHKVPYVNGTPVRTMSACLQAKEIAFAPSVFSSERRTKDAGTVTWWEAQSLRGNTTYKDYILRGQDFTGVRNSSLDPLYALTYELNSAINGRLPESYAIMSLGANFDIAQLHTLYVQLGGVPPWHYKSVRCFRTVRAQLLGALAPANIAKLDAQYFGGIGAKHTAGEDAKNQLQWLLDACALTGTWIY